MGERTGIAWTDSTFNPWTGCVKVSRGCKFCYADREQQRWGNKLWGPNSERQMRAEAYWGNLPKWNRKAIEDGQRHRVFTMSFGDFFEEKRPELIEPRRRSLKLMEECGALDFQVLTKRPHLIRELLTECGYGHWYEPGNWPANVWMGTSIEDGTVCHRIDALEANTPPECVRFGSFEPLTGPLAEGLTPKRAAVLDWFIIGGESGHAEVQPMHPSWAQYALTIAHQMGKAAFFKQWGNFAPYEGKGRTLRFVDPASAKIRPGDVREATMGAGAPYYWSEAGEVLMAYNQAPVGGKWPSPETAGPDIQEFPKRALAIGDVHYRYERKNP